MSRSDTASEPLARRHQTILVLDFGSQYTQLIARRVRENRVYCEIHPHSLSLEEIRRIEPLGLILSGGPQSVYEPGAARVDRALFDLGIPILGICYGMQLAAHLLGGRVEGSGEREYGRAVIERVGSSVLFDGLSQQETVWMSHGDRVLEPPDGFMVCGATENAPAVAIEDPERKIFGIRSTPRSRTRSPAARSCATSSMASAAQGEIGEWPPTWKRRWSW